MSTFIPKFVFSPTFPTFGKQENIPQDDVYQKLASVAQKLISVRIKLISVVSEFVICDYRNLITEKIVIEDSTEYNIIIASG